MFSWCSYGLWMNDTPALRPATTDDLVQALSFALQFEGRKRIYHAADLMAQITAEKLVAHLERSGFVVMRKPPGVAPSTSAMPSMPGTQKGRE